MPSFPEQAHARVSSGRAWTHVLLTGLAYCLAGRLALLLPIQPEGAAGAWPSAGVAFAAMLLIGSRAWTGILLGALALHVGNYVQAHGAAPSPESFALPLLIGFGAAVQAWMGTFLVRQFADWPNSLTGESNVLRFLLLGGPASCIVSATIGIGSLVLLGALPSREIPVAWGMWWVGDTIGTILFTPLILIWFARRDRIRLGRRISVTVPMCLAAAMALVAHRSWQTSIEPAGSLLFTALLGAFLLVVTGRTEAIEQTVAKRTGELEQANQHLRHQIAERIRAEEQHRQSENRFTAAQQVAHLGSWEWDVRFDAIRWSDELYRIYGLVPEEVRIDRAELLRRVHPDDRAMVERTLDQGVRDRKPFEVHHRIVRPDGSVRILHARGEVGGDPTGRTVRMHGTGQDVTELKEAEKELAQRSAELERSNAELERFAYVASHDLQEPLRAVASHVQMLQQDYEGRLDAEADECIRAAVEGAQRMHHLINDYLAYSRLGSEPQAQVPTSSEKALDLALKNLERAIAESRAQVTHDVLPEVTANSAQIVQLFQNLVANAVKFRREECPRVHVTAARADRSWLFSVRDNGIGIDPEHTGRIFSLFQRLHTQDRYPGTGIGLAICKKVVEVHGGRIWVESMPGMGATFWFTLPGVAGQVGPAGAARGPLPAPVREATPEPTPLRVVRSGGPA